MEKAALYERWPAVKISQKKNPEYGLPRLRVTFDSS
jgi:hypothetical protein